MEVINNCARVCTSQPSLCLCTHSKFEEITLAENLEESVWLRPLHHERKTAKYAQELSGLDQHPQVLSIHLSRSILVNAGNREIPTVKVG